MPLPGDQRLPGQDWLVRRITELERKMRELQAGRRLESATIGAGGLRVRGGEIRIQNQDGTADLAVLSSDGIDIGGNPVILPGSISTFGGPAANLPSGWLVCDGAAVSRTEFADLFAAIGATWGPGDGSTTFNLPDLRGRWLVGADGATYTLGSTGGASSHAHTNPATGSAGSHAHTNPNTAATGAHAHTNAATTTEGSHAHGSAGSHAHSLGASTSTASIEVGAFNAADDTHSHSVGSAGSHSHGSDGSHSHGVASTGGVADHAHSQGNTGTEADHTHGQGDTGSASNAPPYAVILPIIRY